MRLVLPKSGPAMAAEGIQQSDDITDQMKQRELVDRLWAICLTVTTHVGRDGMETSRGNRLDLMSPGVSGHSYAGMHH
jgi:hypothetical protein